MREVFIGLVLVVVAFLFGRMTAERPEISEKTQIDTLYVRDTFTREKPVFTRIYTRDSIYITLRDTIKDTIWLPREVKVYEDSLYRAEVSGYQPSLDMIEIYQRERVVTIDKTEIVRVKQPSRWGVGIQVGYGGCVTGGAFKPAPYIGVGVSWNLLTF